MRSLSKIYGLLFAVLILSFPSCRKELSCEETNTCPCTAAVEITDYSYFSSDRVLTDICPNGVDYVIAKEGVFNVLGNLVIEPGVTIEFIDDAGLAINESGSIYAVGTASQPIILKSQGDDLVGAWRGLMIYSDKTANQLSYLTIDGGGSSAFNSNDDKGNIVIYADAKVAIDNCIFKNGSNYGLNANYASGNITSLTNNQFLNNNTPILIRGNIANAVDASNVFSDNINSFVHVRVGDLITSAKVWQSLSIPYQLATANYGITKDQRIGANGRLSLEPGVIVNFELETGITVEGTGTFRAVGTESNKIILKGVDEQAGSWAGLSFSFTQSPSNEISHAIIEHPSTVDGAIYMWANPALKVTNVTFRNISNCVFYDAPKSSIDPPNPNLTMSNNIYENVGSQYCQGS